MERSQQQRAFFDPTSDRKFAGLSAKPTSQQINEMIADSRLMREFVFIENPMDKGSDGSLRERFEAFYHTIFNRYNHQCADMSMIVGGPSGTGKTTLVNLFQADVGLPILRTTGKAIKSADFILQEMQKAYAEYDLEIVAQNHNVELPPGICFIDEAHRIPSSLMDSALLPAMEANDRMLVTESGVKVNCKNLCWILATTEIGKFFHALYYRFKIVQLAAPGTKELVQILRIHFPKVPEEACEQVARYCRSPRIATDFLGEATMYLKKDSSDWQTAIEETARGRGIDSFGLHWKQLSVLRELGNRGPLSKANCALAAQSQVDELEKFILPELMEFWGDRPALITSGS